MRMINRKILITGGQGFVGKNFQRILGPDNDLRIVDLKDGLDCREFFKRSDTVYDLVIHLAAIVGGRMTIEGNPLSVATDLAIDADFFQWALRTKQRRLVYFSSSAAYPIELQTPSDRRHLKESDINLDDIRSPDLTYGWAKLTGEYQARFVNQAGVQTYVFRPFSGYGSDQDLDYPFPSFIKRGLEKADPFEIWGDGEQCRDFIHIDDIINGVLAAILLGHTDPLNLGTGRATSFNELASIVTKACKYSPEFRHLPGNPVGVSYRVADTYKLFSDELDSLFSIYKPRISLEEGVERCLKEMSNR